MAIKAILVRIETEVIRAIDDHRVREYPHKTRGAVVRKALDEYLRWANQLPTPEPAATAKATAITAKAPAPQDWR